MHKKILFLLCLSSIFLFAQEEAPETPQKGEQEAPKEEKEEIRGEFKGKIEDKKPYLKLKFDPYDAVYDYIGAEGFIYDKQLRINSDLASSPLPLLASDQLIKPWLANIVRGDIALFHPMYGYDVADWKLFITDEKGTVFRTYEGKGRPPRKIFWDGRTKDGEMMNAGLTYFYSAEARDSLGNLSRVVGRKITVKGILYKSKGEWIIDLNGNRVFSSEKSTKITEEGEDILQEAADIIKQLFTRQLTIEAYSMNEKLSDKRAEIVTKWLLGHIIVPKNTVIQTAGYTDKVYKTSYIRIVL